jgi:Domain of unknown function (DUF4158)
MARVKCLPTHIERLRAIRELGLSPETSLRLHQNRLLQLAREGAQNAPTGFIRKRWASYVTGPEGIDRRFYELCAMAELKNALRAGDVSVVVLGEDERPHAPILNLIAAQLEIPAMAWALYAERDETRREHLLELLPRLGMEQFGTSHYRALSAWLEPTALQTTRGILLVRAVVEELRRRLVVLRRWQ